MKWDVRTEKDKGVFINQKTGETGHASITRVKYRRAGSRGRFETFVVQGTVPADLQKLVDAYEEQKGTMR